MEESYIKEREWFKCAIDGITYDCYLDNCYGILGEEHIGVTVRKYIQKKWWFFKWKQEEFECNKLINFSTNQYKLVNNNFYYKSEYIKDWVVSALDKREFDILREKSEIEEEKNMKVSLTNNIFY